MINLYDVLVNNGFEKAESNSLSYAVFDTWKLIVEPYESRWNDAEELNVFLYSCDFKDCIAANTNMLALKSTLKMKKNDRGLVGMSMCCLEQTNPIDQTVMLFGPVSLTIAEFLDSLRSVCDLESLLKLLFREKFGKSLVIVEGVWVYIFLCKKAGIDVEQIYSSLFSDHLSYFVKQWDIKDINEELIDSFIV